jgi:hypothetical protein
LKGNGDAKGNGGGKGDEPAKPKLLPVPNAVHQWLDEIRRDVRGHTTTDGLEALRDFIAAHPDEWTRFIATRTRAAA